MHYSKNIANVFIRQGFNFMQVNFAFHLKKLSTPLLTWLMWLLLQRFSDAVINKLIARFLLFIWFTISNRFYNTIINMTWFYNVYNIRKGFFIVSYRRHGLNENAAIKLPDLIAVRAIPEISRQTARIPNEHTVAFDSKKNICGFNLNFCLKVKHVLQKKVKYNMHLHPYTLTHTLTSIISNRCG